MRERLALGVLVFTLLLVIGLSAGFAARRSANGQPPPPVTPKSVEAVSASASSNRAGGGAERNAVVARGRAVYAEQRCASCHAIAGEGNPRFPLDGVGAQLNPDELRQWITGTGGAAEVLTPTVQRRKQRYLTLPEPDLAALVAYLGTLRTARE
jgi:mono/diheme cytochrome c family protein